jgi:hypothetical protein
VILLMVILVVPLTVNSELLSPVLWIRVSVAMAPVP